MILWNPYRRQQRLETCQPRPTFQRCRFRIWVNLLHRRQVVVKKRTMSFLFLSTESKLKVSNKCKHLMKILKFQTLLISNGPQLLHFAFPMCCVRLYSCSTTHFRFSVHPLIFKAKGKSTLISSEPIDFFHQRFICCMRASCSSGPLLLNSPCDCHRIQSCNPHCLFKNTFPFYNLTMDRISLGPYIQQPNFEP